MPQTMSMVSTAPLCGIESKLTDAIAVTRCISSMLIFCSAASCASCSPMVSIVMLKPPEDDPVIPEITAVDTVDTTSALSLTPNIFSCTTAKTAREAMTAPKPTSQAVIKQGKIAFLAPAENSSTDCRARRGNINTTTRIAKARDSAGPPAPVNEWITVTPNIASEHYGGHSPTAKY